jgi:hypothetical protein
LLLRWRPVGLGVRSWGGDKERLTLPCTTACSP